MPKQPSKRRSTDVVFYLDPVAESRLHEAAQALGISDQDLVRQAAGRHLERDEEHDRTRSTLEILACSRGFVTMLLYRKYGQEESRPLIEQSDERAFERTRRILDGPEEPIRRF